MTDRKDQQTQTFWRYMARQRAGRRSWRAEALEWAQHLDREVGETLRRALYFHLFQHPDHLVRAWSLGAPFWAPPVYRLIRRRGVRVLARKLDIDAASVPSDEQRVTEAFVPVSERLARQFGAAFSRADVTLAELERAAPAARGASLALAQGSGPDPRGRGARTPPKRDARRAARGRELRETTARLRAGARVAARHQHVRRRSVLLSIARWVAVRGRKTQSALRAAGPSSLDVTSDAGFIYQDALRGQAAQNGRNRPHDVAPQESFAIVGR